MKRILSFDCGGTYVKYAVIAEDGTFLKKGKFPTEKTDKEQFLSSLADTYHQLTKELKEPVDAIGICTPGMVDTERGYLYTGGAIECLEDTPLAEILSKRCDNVLVSVENDAKSAARAELESGALKDCKNGIVLAVGTAIGGTIVIDRKILRGSHLFAGEVSYGYYANDIMNEKASQFLAKESLHAHWARRCGSSRMRELYCEFSGEMIDDAHGADLFIRLKAGDENAKKAVQICCHDFAMLIFNLQCVVDPDVVAIGGGISSEPVYIEMLQKEAEEYARLSFPGAPVPNICACQYQNDANLLGVFYAALQSISG